MASVNFEGKDYDLDDLSDKAKANIVSLQFVQSELKRLQSQSAVLKTAEAAYAATLKAEIEN